MIKLNYRDSRPIYEQIKEGLRNLVVTGAIETGERLPSVRDMAAMMAINPNTIQRAYRELESEGYIYSVQGKGSFAAERQDVSPERAEGLFKELGKIITELRYLGIDDQEIFERIRGGEGK